jgi:ABC-type nitrate/sulfonate/bicarbonate transport system substrate-binding protein
MVHGIFARNEFIAQNEDTTRRFLAAWFKTIAFMKKNRDETVQIIAEAIHVDPKVIGREYDLEIEMFSTDGKFQPAAIAKLATAFAEPLDLSKYYTEKYLPVSN